MQFQVFSSRGLAASRDEADGCSLRLPLLLVVAKELRSWSEWACWVGKVLSAWHMALRLEFPASAEAAATVEVT